MNGQFYFNKVRAAMNAWVTQGYKNDYEQINAFIANVTERDLSLLKAQYKEILQRSMMTGLASSSRSRPSAPPISRRLPAGRNSPSTRGIIRTTPTPRSTTTV